MVAESYLAFDYPLARACVEHEKYAWEDFVDRFMEPVLRIVEKTAESRGVSLTDEAKIELCEAIFRSFRYNDYQLLREFAWRSSLTSYLTVLTRRLAIAFLSDE